MTTIAHARRIGTPVILIDPTFINSRVLRDMVGSDCVVETLTDAIDKLESKIAPNLVRTVQLEKRNGDRVDFDKRKLQRSLRALFNQSKVDDAVLLSLVLRRAIKNLYERASAGAAVPTSIVKEIVFFEMKSLAAERKNADLNSLIKTLSAAWLEHEGKKDSNRYLDDVARELHEVRASLTAMELERDNLEARLRQAEISSINIQAEAVKSSPTLFDRLVDAMDSRKVLCIHHVDCSGFRSKLLRAGLSEDEFNLLFEERGLDGRQSGLNHDLKARFEELRLCPLRLYEASPR